MKKYCMFYITFIDQLDGLEKYLEYIFEYGKTKDNITFSDLRFIYENDKNQMLIISEDKTRWINRSLSNLKPYYNNDIISLPDDTYYKIFVEAETDEDAIKQCMLLKEIGAK